LEFNLPQEYPNSSCITHLMNPIEQIPDLIKIKVEKAILNRAEIAYKGKPMILGLIRWLKNNLENLLIDKQITTQYLGMEFINNEDKSSLSDHPSPPVESQLESDHVKMEDDKEDNKEDDKEDDKEESLIESKEEEENVFNEEKQEQSYSTTTAHRGTQINAEGIKLIGIGLLECTEMNLVIVCGRCKTQLQLKLQDNNTYAQECDNCHNSNFITYRREHMHENSSIIGYIDIDGCIPFDLLDSPFKGTCLGCSGDIIFKSIAFSGFEYLQNCLNCHSKVSVSINSIKFHKIRAVRPPSDIIIKKKKQKDPLLIGIKVGSPLPSNGTCKHYKKSFRWMRFPCCKRVYPCDLCHEEEKTDDHDLRWANRMLCGYCSKEQLFSEKCNNCGTFFEGKSSPFWEGGKGCREIAKMSNKDQHKFRGQFKTQSQKENRVGPKKN